MRQVHRLATSAVTSMFVLLNITAIATPAQAVGRQTFDFDPPGTSETPRITHTEGDMLTIYDPLADQTIGVVAINGGASADIYSVGTSAVYETTTSVSTSEFTYFSVNSYSYGIKLVSSGSESMQANSCCVTCDGWTSCGCPVEASCGSCCVNPCCD